MLNDKDLAFVVLFPILAVLFFISLYCIITKEVMPSV